MNYGQPAPRHDEPPVSKMCEIVSYSFDLGGRSQIKRGNLHAERRCHRLDCAKLSGPCRYGGIANYTDTLNCWSDLFQELQPFCANAIFKLAKASSIPTWMGQSFSIT